MIDPKKDDKEKERTRPQASWLSAASRVRPSSSSLVWIRAAVVGGPVLSPSVWRAGSAVDIRPFIGFITPTSDPPAHALIIPLTELEDLGWRGLVGARTIAV